MDTPQIKIVDVKFLVDQSAPAFGDKKKDQVIPINYDTAKILESRGIIKIISKKAESKK